MKGWIEVTTAVTESKDERVKININNITHVKDIGRHNYKNLSEIYVAASTGQSQGYIKAKESFDKVMELITEAQK